MATSDYSDFSERFRDAQRHRSLTHPILPQPTEPSTEKNEQQAHRPSHRFVVCADTQFGLQSGCREWETELEYSRQAVEKINSIEPRPLFCCMCGDLGDMEQSFFVNKGFTLEECYKIQDDQYHDYQRVWSQLHEDIATVCICGNHDVGNRPTSTSINRFKNAFGDDYLAFWANGTYNIVLNSSLFSDPTDAMDLYKDQLAWLQDRLEYAKERDASCIFVFSHHPWFLQTENEQDEDLEGMCPYPKEWEWMGEGGWQDSYFHIPFKYRKRVMELFKEYKVTAAFSGHFHQNHITKASFGMDMIVTSSLSLVFRSTAKPKELDEPNCRGFRIVDVKADSKEKASFSHRFVPL